MREIGISSERTVSEFGMDAAYALYREAGFTGIDWNVDEAVDQAALSRGDYAAAHCIFEKPLEEVVAHFQPEYDAIRKSGLKVIQAHAPYPPHPYGPYDPSSLDHTIPILINCVRFCHRMGVPRLVVHGARGRYLTPEMTGFLNGKLYDALAVAAQEGDTVICLETLFYADNRPSLMMDPADAIETVDRLNDKVGGELFGICLDTGHMNLVGADIPAYVRAVGGRIKALHLHDNDGTDDQHLAPYTGTVPWKATMEALRDAGYEGDVSFESYRQTILDRVDREMVLPWLKLVGACGAYFRDLLEKKA